MTTFRIVIQPVSPGTRGGESGLKAGTGTYLTTPQGERSLVLEMSQAQIVGVQGYLTAIRAGTNTGTVETAITAIVT